MESDPTSSFSESERDATEVRGDRRSDADAGERPIEEKSSRSAEEPDEEDEEEDAVDEEWWRFMLSDPVDVVEVGPGPAVMSVRSVPLKVRSEASISVSEPDSSVQLSRDDEDEVQL